ncbi:MAG: MATE family efflux transporter [Acidobacteriota bacterium]
MRSPSSAQPADHDLRARFFRLSALNILANLTVPVVGLVDAAMLGHLEEIHFLAGVALGTVVFDFVFWSFGFLRMATSGLTAQAVGRRDSAEIEAILRRSLVIAAGAGLALLALREPLGSLAFTLLSGDAATEGAGLAYYHARVLGAPAALANFVFLGWFLGREESGVALWMTLSANLVNVVLDYVFILHLDWNAAGAGLATMISQYVMLAVALVFYWPRRFRGEGLEIRSVFGVSRWASMFGLQRDIFFRTLFLVGTFALFTNFSARFGTEALAANTLLLRLIALAAFFVDGAAFAIESLAGILRGAGLDASLRRLLRLGLNSGFAMAGFFVAAVGLFPSAILGLLTSHASVIDLAAGLRGWLIPVLLIGSAAYILDGLFLGLTAGRPLRNAMIFSAALGFLPLAWVAIELESLQVLWAALSGFMLLRVVTLSWLSRPLLSSGEG